MPARRASADEPAAKRAPAKKAPAKKAPARKAPAKEQAPAQRASAKKAPAKKQAPAKKAPAKKQASAKKAPAKKQAPSKKAPPRRPPPADVDATAAVDSVELLGGPRRQLVVRDQRSPQHDEHAHGLLPPGDDPGHVPWSPDPPVAAAPPAPARPSGPGVHETGDGRAVRVTRGGKVKKLRGKHKRIYKAKKKPPSRLLNHYDVNGPRIRLGFLWFLLVGFAIAVETGSDLPAIALVYGSAAGFAGWQAAREWNKRTAGAPVQWASAAIGAGIGLAGAASPGVVGLTAVAAVVVAGAAAAIDPEAREALPGNLALTLQCGLVPGVAAASIALTWRVEPSAAIALFLLVCAYEVGDYVVGSGSLNAFEGPIAGILAVLAITLPLYAVQLPPINPDTVVLFVLIIAVGCPLSQIVGSAVLPWSDAPAPAVRRLDSLMLTGPVWLFAVYVETGVL